MTGFVQINQTFAYLRYAIHNTYATHTFQTVFFTKRLPSRTKKYRGAKDSARFRKT